MGQDWHRQVIRVEIVLLAQVRAALPVPVLVETVVAVDSLEAFHQVELRLASLRVVVMEDMVVAVDLVGAAKVVTAMEVKGRSDLVKIREVMEVDGLRGAQAPMVMDLLVVAAVPVDMVEDSRKRLRLRNTWIDRCRQSRS